MDMDFGSQVTVKVVEVPPIHEHPLLPCTRFIYGDCDKCGVSGYMYGGYCCNELGCGYVFHKECARYRPDRLPILDNSNLHEHPLELLSVELTSSTKHCKTCNQVVVNDNNEEYYKCNECDLVFHQGCAEYFPEANHISHPQHPLKLLTCEAAPNYVDKECLLCGDTFQGRLHHCDVCNFSICGDCMSNPPPLVHLSPTTHDHQLHLVPRRLDFTCNACGEKGDQSPYLCLQCDFMIHWECIDLPRVININRHDHRISYTRHLGGHGVWKCKVCRKRIDSLYGAYTCSKCPGFAVHSRCASRIDVWDLRELEGMPEEEEIPPFEVIDDKTIIHCSHRGHHLGINKDGHSLPENIVCEACRLQIFSSEPFYSCKECSFILHEICANHPLKKRHVLSNQQFTLVTETACEVVSCALCGYYFTGFRYEVSDLVTIDVRCAAVSDTLNHGSHQHRLYYESTYKDRKRGCSRCGEYRTRNFYKCESHKCDYVLDGKCVVFPEKVMKIRYDDHPLFLSFGDMDHVDGDYWCDACETKVNPKDWFYTCNDCGTTLHISCVVGDFSFSKQGSEILREGAQGRVVHNTSICRPICSVCNSRCTLPSFIELPRANGVVYVCSQICLREMKNESCSLYAWDKLVELQNLENLVGQTFNQPC